MKLNVENFKSVLQKATLNFSIESVQLNIKSDVVETKMVMQSSKDAITILKVVNDFLETKPNSEHVLNFSDPSSSVMPYIGLIDDELADVKLFDEKMVVTTGKQKMTLFFCAPQVVSVFSANAPRNDLSYFISFDLDEFFIRCFNKIKKVGMRFGKIYFNVDNNTFTMESTDKQNALSNGIKFDLMECKEKDLTLCFDYKNFANLMTVIGERFDEFRAHFTYVREQNLGMTFFEKKDGSEKYYLMSKMES